MDNPYDILGIPESSSKKDIEKAYKKLSSKLHPDKGGNDFLFNKIKVARDELIGDNIKLSNNNLLEFFSLFDDLVEDSFYSESYNYSNINGDENEELVVNNNGIVNRYKNGMLIKK